MAEVWRSENNEIILLGHVPGADAPGAAPENRRRDD
jgi:hypothetical protein